MDQSRARRMRVEHSKSAVSLSCDITRARTNQNAQILSQVFKNI